MKTDYTYFVDCMLPDGTWEYGSIGSNAESAESWAEYIRQQHPDWLVEINPVEKKGL